MYMFDCDKISIFINNRGIHSIYEPKNNEEEEKRSNIKLRYLMIDCTDQVAIIVTLIIIIIAK